jgi:hypothetical protein
MPYVFTKKHTPPKELQLMISSMLRIQAPLPAAVSYSSLQPQQVNLITLINHSYLAENPVAADRIMCKCCTLAYKQLSVTGIMVFFNNDIVCLTDCWHF